MTDPLTPEKAQAVRLLLTRQGTAQQLLCIAVNSGCASEALLHAEAMMRGALDAIASLVSYECAYNIAQRLADGVVQQQPQSAFQGAPPDEQT